jgi:predicted Zn-dependent peptidase
MRVFLNNRGKSPNAAMRLVVGTGMNDYPCDKRELPHLVEHLMFSGYDDISESDLDGMIAQWGGSWNAYTYGERTTYDIKIFSDFLDQATLLLNMMFEETHVTHEELEAARAIVHAEAGGVARALFANTFISMGYTKVTSSVHIVAMYLVVRNGARH